MATTWIVAADSSRARILQVADRRRLDEIDALLNPEGRLHDRELVTDTHARQEMLAVEHMVELFAKRVGDYLENARTRQRYDRLHLVAPPKFLGVLRKKLGKDVGKLVLDEIPKDLSWFNAREIERYFAKGSARAP